MMNNPSEDDDISNVDHATGRAKKTQGGDGAAIKLFEFWLKVVKQKVKWKIDEVTSKQIENKKKFILIYCLQHVVLHNSHSFDGTSFFSTCNSLQIEQRPEP